MIFRVIVIGHLLGTHQASAAFPEPHGRYPQIDNLTVLATLDQGPNTSQGAPDEASQSVKGITRYPGFKNLCTAVVVGAAPVPEHGSALFPVFGRYEGECAPGANPLLLSVTHENAHNSHEGALNSGKDMVAYMGDLDAESDFGKWVDLSVDRSQPQTQVALLLDTVNFKKTNVTGWPLQYGHLFAGLNDLSVHARLDRRVVVEFDIRVDAREIRSELYEGYSGSRIMVGVKGEWPESPPRTNTTHFLEVDLTQSDGYSASYGDPERPLCHDRIYDRCFYNPEGKYAEGREIRSDSPLGEPSQIWTHVRLPLSEMFRAERWVSPPASWGEASLSGLYIGIESGGATRTRFALKNYRVYAEQ